MNNTLEHKFRCNRKNGKEIYGSNCNDKAEECYEFFCPNHSCNNCEYYQNYDKECHMKCNDFINHPYYKVHFEGKFNDPVNHMKIDQNINKAVKKIITKTVEGFEED